jgi:hypothetical protein
MRILLHAPVSTAERHENRATSQTQQVYENTLHPLEDALGPRPSQSKVLNYRNIQGCSDHNGVLDGALDSLDSNSKMELGLLMQICGAQSRFQAVAKFIPSVGRRTGIVHCCSYAHGQGGYTFYADLNITGEQKISHVFSVYSSPGM